MSASSNNANSTSPARINRWLYEIMAQQQQFILWLQRFARCTFVLHLDEVENRCLVMFLLYPFLVMEIQGPQRAKTHPTFNYGKTPTYQPTSPMKYIAVSDVHLCNYMYSIEFILSFSFGMWEKRPYWTELLASQPNLGWRLIVGIWEMGWHI